MNILTSLAYLISSVLFILGLKMLSSPKTARKGNLFGAVGMLMAVVVTLVDKRIIDFSYIMAGLVVGSAAGAVLAKKVQMTAMPQMVGLLNGFGGGASTLVACAEYLRNPHEPSLIVLITIVLSVLIGAVTFWGSLVAFAKLQEMLPGAPITYRLQKETNAGLLGVVLILGTFFITDPARWQLLMVIITLSSILGFTSTIPIGGADMPVVIALLNSYSGMAAAATGFVLSNNALIISGTLVGASGIILSKVMCKAMNRSLGNVLFGAVGADKAALSPEREKRTVVRYTPQDAAFMLESAQSVIIVPGYGLAVAQAQHILHELASLLMKRGLSVRYAIHPVAGRMPGHMNVLLAEANVPYDMLWEMEKINSDFQNTDIVLVIGANDVVNPAARYKKSSPLYGMPILDVGRARTVIVCKRSLNPGFAGEDNDLFYDKKTMMVFGDAKTTLTDLVLLLKG
ncbi:MAG: NAD(P)(+) transhydrogenase (Re/Si-specific) subunit beta [Candidatus Tectomicrobia bacterium]|uniref:NAD(P) transhydrogenase subunit beta n=1 Tax=Tectimicrobiota bacterium TaxID=2528274 RepID=A0A933GJX9_UNCTE|nr:NAD(P)(+) transhydrogenase (Re/Si-specific) subunit beta [Candidatus Tectomicrobia bacterium]